jgi:hypothetical protein
MGQLANQMVLVPVYVRRRSFFTHLCRLNMGIFSCADVTSFLRIFFFWGEYECLK